MRFAKGAVATGIISAAFAGLLPTLAWAQSRGATPLASPGLPLAAPQFNGRLIDVIDIDEHESQVDITLQFNCSLHYAGHAPASEGSEVRLRLRLGSDCGPASSPGGAEVAAEIPPISGPSGIVTSAALESTAGGEVTLTLSWARPESFVLAQGASSSGMRIRLLRQRAEKPRILVTDRGDIASNYAVNLESQRTAFDPGAVEQASRRLQTATFVSEVDTGGEHWYRLRAGPFDQRAVAESVLRTATRDYPRAWLAVGDDSVTNDPNAAIAEPKLPPVETIGVDEALKSAELASLLSEARRAMRSRDYPQAVQILTKLQRQPEFPQRAEVQELLGLVRERSGEVAQAKAEYEEYLRRYPQGPAAGRVRTRLRILRSAAATSRSGGLDAGESDHGWKVSGGASQLYRRDSFGSDLNGPLFATLVQNAVFTDADLFVHRNGERFNTAFRSNFGYVQNFLPADTIGAANHGYISTAYLDLNDKLWGVRGRVGRQTAITDGIFGTFDGGVLAYRFAPSWTVRGTFGMPLDSSRDALQTQRRFETLALGFAPSLSHWDTSIYFTQQKDGGIRDRQAVGSEVQYAAPGRSLVGYLDYDTAYQSLNAVVLMGSVQLPARWQITLDLEHRNSPLLTTRNALFGQTAVSLAALARIYNLQQISELARDRTAELSTYSASATKQLGERFQVIFDLFYTQFSDTPASGGVEAFSGADSNDKAGQVQLLASGLLFANDFNQIAVRYDKTAQFNLTGCQFLSRYPLFGAWRLGPRILVQRKETDTGFTQMLYTPAGRLDYQRHGRVLEFEAGAELGHNPAGLDLGNTTRLFASAGYRINF